MYKVDLNEFEDVGLFRNSHHAFDHELKKFKPAELALLIEIGNHGENGLHKKTFEKNYKKSAELLICLEMASLVKWERDNNGRPIFLCLTWKGDELFKHALEAAKYLNQLDSSRKLSTPLIQD